MRCEFVARLGAFFAIREFRVAPELSHTWFCPASVSSVLLVMHILHEESRAPRHGRATKKVCTLGLRSKQAREAGAVSVPEQREALLLYSPRSVHCISLRVFSSDRPAQSSYSPVGIFVPSPKSCGQ